MRHVIQKTIQRLQSGYVLPATILLSVAISILSGILLQTTASTNDALNTQSYRAIAQDAARAGIKYAIGCLSGGYSWDTAQLRPDTDCTGTDPVPTNDPANLEYVVSNADLNSTFSVTSKDIDSNVTSTGTVQLMHNGVVYKTYRATAKTSLAKSYTTVPISAGESITDIKNDATDCAIANGKLYCWGNNASGQVGDGTTTDRATPTLVQGALAGKTVTRVSVAQNSVCAIADGTPYCWGDDGNNQLGNGASGSVRIPTADTPRTSSGPLSGKIVTDISTSSMNNPANAIWVFATAFPHTCALTEDGAVSCWGDGGFRQNTGGGCIIAIFICTGYYSYPSYSVPTLTEGYAGGGELLSGKKSERVGASSHDSCSFAQGKLICWGVQAPIAIWCNSVLFSAAWETIVPFNPCVASYSNGYDTHAIGGSDLSGKFIDPASWNVSANETCVMANTDYVCFGTTPAFDLFWLDSWGAPWTAMTNADVTDSDNGDNANSWGVTGLFCMVNRGVPNCAGQPGSGYTGTGTSGWKYFQPLITTSDLAGKNATKIAAGQDHGCVVANGQLLCWGYGGNGTLADGNTGWHIVNTATRTGTGGATPIGSANGTYAANGQISSGDKHSCAAANGQLFCWGDNTFGQLGMGDKVATSQPQAIPSLSTYKSVTKVSAGSEHTCAIIEGKLYCWGHNNNGQLGIGSTIDKDTPQLVGGLLAGKRVTDVSAGTSGTCAIANSIAYCWGLNTNQQVGDGTVITRTSPVQVTGGAGILTGKASTAISLGTSHACAVANADLFCWGSNANGRTGLNTIVGNANPTQVTAFKTAANAVVPNGPNGMLPSVSNVSAGEDFTCAIINGGVSCWGSNANGRTGRGTAVGDQIVPRELNGAPGGYYATSISAGDAHACAILNGNASATNGNIYCWGAGADGRIGNNTPFDQLTAVVINGGDTLNGGVRQVATSVDAGGASSCGVANAVILCWGDGAFGQLGNGTLVDSMVPSKSKDFRFLAPFSAGPVF